MGELGEGLSRFQGFLRQLKADLAKAQELRDGTLSEIEVYEELESNIQLLQQEGLREMTTLAPLGAGVFCKAHVPDTSHLLVDVGLGFHAECTLSEALGVAATKLEHLRQVAEVRSKQVAKIKAHTMLVEQGLAGLGELQQ